jgi:hypothetical protein
VKLLRNDGFTATTGRGEVKPITKWMVHKIFDGNGVQNLLEVALPKDPDNEEGTNWDTFAGQHLNVTCARAR